MKIIPQYRVRALLSVFLMSCFVSCATTDGDSDKKDSSRSSDSKSSSNQRDATPEELDLSNSLRAVTHSLSNNSLTPVVFNKIKAEDAVRKLESTVKSEGGKDRSNIVGLMAAQRLAGLSIGNIVSTARRLIEIEVKVNVDREIPEVAKLELALAAMRQQQFGFAEHFLDDLLRSKQARIRASALTAQGVMALSDDRIPEAVSLWQEALKVVPDFQPAQFNLGYIALRSGDARTAIQMLGNMQDQWFAMSALVSAERLAGDTAKASSFCEKLMSQKPNYKPALYNCALNEFQNAKNLDKAKAILEKMVKNRGGRADYDDRAFKLISRIDMEKAQVPVKPAATEPGK